MKREIILLKTLLQDCMEGSKNKNIQSQLLKKMQRYVNIKKNL